MANLDGCPNGRSPTKGGAFAGNPWATALFEGMTFGLMDYVLVKKNKMVTCWKSHSSKRYVIAKAACAEVQIESDMTC